MSRELLASQKNNSGILLDPRTKLAVLITIAVFILSLIHISLRLLVEGSAPKPL